MVDVSGLYNAPVKSDSACKKKRKRSNKSNFSMLFLQTTRVETELSQPAISTVQPKPSVDLY